MLEELKELYGTAFTTTIINLKAREQKEEWFLRINPNGPLLPYPFPEILPGNPFFSFLLFLSSRAISDHER